MKKRTCKKAVAWLLLSGITAGVLGGCGKTAESGVNPTEQASKRTQEINQESAENKTVAMGRYRETEVELPDQVKEQTWIQFFKGKDGNLELYTADRNTSETVEEACCYIFRDGTWEKEKDWLGNTVLKENNIDFCYVVYGKDGYYYLGGTDENYIYHLFKLEENGEAQEILQEVFQPKEGKDYGLIPPKIEVLENGNLMVFEYHKVYLYTPSGSQVFSIAKDFSGNTTDNRGFCEGEEFITVQENNLVRYSLKDGNLIETIAFDEIKSGRSQIELFGDGSGGIYIAGETGLAHTNRGGSLWEILIDGSLNHMGMRSIYLQAFLEGENQDYYGVFTNEGSRDMQIFHYEYDPDMESVPPNTLTIYSLEDHSTVRQAASLFQNDHPEVKVEIRTAVENGGNITEEIIHSLNTELLSQKGADILILDDLPVDSYIEKGVLMDLHELIEDIEASDTMLNNIFNGFMQEDGNIYQVPARVSFPLLLGDEKALQAYSSLTSMAGYSGENPLTAPSNYENLLRKTAHLQYTELIENGKIMEREGLLQYLETVKSIGESNGSKTFFTQEEMNEKWVSNNVTRNGIVGTSVDYDSGRCDSGIECLDGYADLCIPMEIRRRHPEIQITTFKGLYLPSTLAGITHSTVNADLAKEFIRCLLSYDVQKENLYDGFPVNKRALQTLAEKDNDGYSVSIGFNNSDYYLTAKWPTFEERQEIAAMLEELTIPALVDETMMKMIVEGSQNYFDGNETAEQAAEEILRKLSIYQAE